MSDSNCCFLTHIQVSQEANKVVWYSHLFKNFSQFVVIHTVKDFGIVNKAEVDIFLELSCFFNDPVLALWSLVLLPFLNPAWTSRNSWFMYCWSLAWHVEAWHYFASVWDECNCPVVWTFFGIAFLWDWNETFSRPVAAAEFSRFAGILSEALSQHHLLGFEIAQLEFHYLH